MASQTIQVGLQYRIFFLYIEPFFTLLGAYYAFFQPQTYLLLTHAASAPKYGIPTSTQIVMSQLANLYLLFAVNEAILLRTTSDLKVWRAVIVGLLIADCGHLYSVRPLGAQIYWAVDRWNSIDWGNIGFVYLGALMRISFLTKPTGIPGLTGRWTTKASTTPRRSARRTRPSSRFKD